MQNVGLACCKEGRICRLIHGPSCSERSVMMLDMLLICSSSYILVINSLLSGLGQSKSTDKARFW